MKLQTTEKKGGGFSTGKDKLKTLFFHRRSKSRWSRHYLKPHSHSRNFCLLCKLYGIAYLPMLVAPFCPLDHQGHAGHALPKMKEPLNQEGNLNRGTRGKLRIYVSQPKFCINLASVRGFPEFINFHCIKRHSWRYPCVADSQEIQELSVCNIMFSSYNLHSHQSYI